MRKSFLLAAVLLALPAQAQTAKPAATPAYASAQPNFASSREKLSSSPTPPAWIAAGSTYAPDGCEFQIAFPEEPYQGKRCDALDPTNCTEATTFTKVYGLDATIAYTVSCNPTGKDLYDQYSDNVMKAALFAMAQPSNLGKSQTGFGILPQAKMAVLLGSGKAANNDDVLYTGQIWVGHKSILTIEGKLSGSYNADSDRLFAEILKTARIRDKASDKPVDAARDKKGK